MKGILPDTNIWLHAREPIDFAAIADGDEFVVIVPHRVLSELDAKQHDARASIRKRARRQLMRLNHIVTTGVQREDGIEASDEGGTTYRLVMDAETPPSATADDVIVATAAALSSLEPLIVTSDAAMQMTAKLAGVQVRLLTPDQLEPDEGEALDQRVAALERQVKSLKDPQPLTVDVVAQPLWPEGNPPTLIRLSGPSQADLHEIQRQVQIKMQLPQVTPGVVRVGEREYLEAVPGYAENVAGYMAARARWEACAEAAFQVQVLVINRTINPVDEAVLELRAPSFVYFRYPPPRPEAPNAPSPPAADPLPSSGSIGFPGLGGLSALSTLTTASAVPYLPSIPFVSSVPVRGPSVRTEMRWAEMRLDEPLRPDHEAFAGRLWIALEPEFEGTDVDIQYTLYAASPGKPASGQMRVTIAWRDDAWRAPRLPTLGNRSIDAIGRADQKEREADARAERDRDER